MPRSRRRHHSRSRSRSNSHDRDREPKRRKVESFESPHNRRSVSSEPEANESVVESVENVDAERAASAERETSPTDAGLDVGLDVSVASGGDPNTSVKLLTTPQKSLTPKQRQKRLESEKKRAERAKEKEAAWKRKQAEKDERQRAKQAKEAKLKEERDARLKEKEEKDRERETRRKEKEEKDREREEVRMKRLAEKRKIEESKQKAAAAFTKFFVAKVGGAQREEASSDGAHFMPFPIKADMRLAPTARNALTSEQKRALVDFVAQQTSESDYFARLKTVGSRTSARTWPHEDIVNDDVQIVSNAGCTTTVMKAKFLKFHENRRPAYFGTWRRKSRRINGRDYLGQDPSMNYEVESDDEWEEEEEGEDIVGSDDEDRQDEHDEENNDYEVDDEFFVPHGHLSEDEEDDDDENISPEMRKAKEKLLKNQFDEERKAKTQRLRSRVIGCVWYGKRDDNGDGAVDRALDLILRPYRAISSGVVKIRKREDFEAAGKAKKWSLEKEHWPDLIRLLHGNTNKRRALSNEFAEFMAKKKDLVGGVKKAALSKLIQAVAKWGKCKVEGGMYNKMCWMVKEDVRMEFPGVKLSLPNCWKYCTVLNAKDD